jgi:hypothetical protein
MKTNMIAYMFIPIMCICTIGLILYGIDTGNDRLINYATFIGVSITLLFLWYTYVKCKLQNDQ